MTAAPTVPEASVSRDENRRMTAPAGVEARGRLMFCGIRVFVWIWFYSSVRGSQETPLRSFIPARRLQAADRTVSSPPPATAVLLFALMRWGRWGSYPGNGIVAQGSFRFQTFRLAFPTGARSLQSPQTLLRDIVPKVSSSLRACLTCFPFINIPSASCAEQLARNALSVSSQDRKRALRLSSWYRHARSASVRLRRENSTPSAAQQAPNIDSASQAAAARAARP